MMAFFRERCWLFFLLSCLLVSLLFDSIIVFDLLSVSRLFSFIFIVIFIVFFEKEKLLQSFFIMWPLFALLLSLLLRSFFSGFDFSDPYFYALFLNFFLSISVLGVALKAGDLSFFIVPFLISFFFALVSLFGLGVDILEQDYRVTFMRLNQNEYASFLLFGLVSGIYFSLMRFERFSFLYMLFCFMFVVLLNAIMNTGTRFSILSAFFCLSLCSFVSYARYKSFCLSASYFGVAFLVIMLEYLSYACFNYEFLALGFTGFPCEFFSGRSSFLERFDIVDTGINHNISSLGGRIDLWLIAVRSFGESPYIGLGYEGFKEFSLLEYGYFSRPHNFFLEILAIGGLLSFAFLCYFLKILAVLVRNKGFFVSLLMGTPLIIMSLMLNISYFKLFWVYLAMFFFFLHCNRFSCLSVD